MPVFQIWPIGCVPEISKPAKLKMYGLFFCEDCKTMLKINDFLTDHEWYQIKANFYQDIAQPDRRSMRLEWIERGQI